MKTGLVVPSICLALRLSIRPSTTFWYLVCVICNSKSFHSFLFNLCIMIVLILKMCTSYIEHISQFFLTFEGCWTKTFFHPKYIGVLSLCNLLLPTIFIPLYLNVRCIVIVRILKMCTSRLSYAHFMIFFSFLRDDKLGHFYIQNA